MPKILVAIGVGLSQGRTAEQGGFVLVQPKLSAALSEPTE